MLASDKDSIINIKRLSPSIDIIEKTLKEIASDPKVPLLPQYTISNLPLLIYDRKNRKDALPEQIYWMDLSGKIVGCNEQQVKIFGFSSKQELLGKDIYDVGQRLGWDRSISDKIHANNMLVLQTKRAIIEEEVVVINNKKRFFLVHKSPLYDENKEIKGIVGFSIDITAQKEAEFLRVENEAQRIRLQEQEKFHRITNQLSHDIRSPLSTLRMWYASVKHKLSEKERIIGHNALNRANDILNSGFLRYKPAIAESSHPRGDTRTEAIIFSILEQVIAEKRLEYQQQPIAFEIECPPSATFACFQVKESDFKRMISNLVNNAVDAFENHPGKIFFHLNANRESITLIIQDNGKGMSESVRKKILNHTAITSGKKHGNGIGFTQVWDALNACGGKLSIASTPRVGTQVQLMFPRVPAPAWMVENILLSPHDIVVIVDDDPGIHDAWQAHFQRYAYGIKLIDFEKGEEAVAFLQSFHPKKNIFLLTDYELLNQPLNGLDIIEKAEVKRAILVTNHSGNKEVQQKALALNARILPKVLAVNIPIIWQKNG